MLLFGSIYSNLETLRALLIVAKQNNIPAENSICTGDIVAYCTDAEESVNAVRAFYTRYWQVIVRCNYHKTHRIVVVGLKKAQSVQFFHVVGKRIR
jgi:hypothetical protein